jgi:hypothetical protein
MLSQYINISNELSSDNPESAAYIDLSNYDYCVLQIANSGNSYNFYSTNDSNAITGVSDGSISSSINYVQIGGLNLFSNTYETSAASDGIWRFNVVGKYLKIEYAGGGDTNVDGFVMLSKIS